MAPRPDLGAPTGYERLEASRPTAAQASIAPVAVSSGPAPAAGSPAVFFAESPVAKFETLPIGIDPAEVLPFALLEGPHHRVVATRLETSFLHTFTLETEAGPIEVTGRSLLREHIREIETLAAYDARQINGPELYAIELANAAEEPFEGTLQIVRHPVRTVTSIPLGIAQSYRAFGEMRKGGRTHVEDDYAAELVGVSQQKRLWAERLGVDPYSTNPLVQARLARNGWLSFASQMTVRLATIPVPAAGATIALATIGATSGIGDKLADEAPEDVRLRTRTFLVEELDLEPTLTEAFLAHPWYSPTQQHRIIEALTGLSGVRGRDRFIEMTIRADDRNEARAFTRIAQLIGETHRRRMPLVEIDSVRDLVVARSSDGRAVLPLDVDHLHWTAEVAGAESDVRRMLFERGAPTGLVTILTGDVSSRARREFVHRGWEVVGRCDDAWLSEPRATPTLLVEAGSGRILPEFGGFGRHHGESATAVSTVAQATGVARVATWTSPGFASAAGPTECAVIH